MDENNNLNENNNPFINPETNTSGNQPGAGANQDNASQNGSAQSEHTGYEQPGYGQTGYGQPDYGQQNQQAQNPQQYNQQYNQGQYQPDQQQYNQYQLNNQNPYGQNQYNQYQQYEPPKNNSMAVASLICGIISFLLSCCWFISLPLAVVSLVLGIIVLSKKKDGKSLAIVGIVLAAITIIFCIVIFIFYAFMINGNGELNNFYKQYYNEFYQNFYNGVESSAY